MRKYIIGGMAGFALAFTVSAHAEEAVSFIGRTVQGAFPVKLNGQTLNNQAIVVDGTSYLPVRAMGEALGYDIFFDADMGITLQKQADSDMQPNDPSEDAAPDSSVPAAGTDPETGYVKLTKAVFSLTIDDKIKTYRKTGDFEYIEAGGSQYLSVIALSSVYTVTWNDPVFSISLDDQLVTAVASGTPYIKDTSAFSYGGTTFVNLSTLGLHATVDGDTLVVEESL